MGLDLHAFFRSHEDSFSVYMRRKMNTLLGYFTQLRQRKYLESAAIGQNRLLPVKELVKTTHTVDQIVTGTDMQVISVGKLNLAIDILKIARGDTALDSGARAYVHKNGCLNRAVDGVKTASAGFSFGF